LSILVLICATPVRADWPHVRGPRYDGVSDESGLNDAWPVDGPKRVWSLEMGQGHSGIVVGDGRLFTQRQSAAGQFLVCLSPTTGDLLWETRYARPWQLHGAYPGPYATPTYNRGKVYFASPTGMVGCADAATGEMIWSVDVQERFGGRGYDFGFAATPLVEDGRVFLPVGGASASLVALDATDGHTLWAGGSDKASYCPAFPIVLGGRRCIVGYMENALLIADSAHGAIVYRQRLSQGYDEHSAWPIYREPRLLLTGPFRAGATCSQLDGNPDGSLRLKEIWSSKSMSNDVASSVLYGDSLYGFDLKQLQSSAHRPSRGVFRCLDWSTGAVRWSTDKVGHATVLAADGLLFLFTDAGELVLIRADPAKYDERGRTTLFEDDICWTPPALWRGRLYVRSPSRLVCLHVAREEILAMDTPRPATPRSNRIDPGWLLTREREFPNDAPSVQEARLWFGASLILLGAAALGARATSVAVEWLIGKRIPMMPLFLAFATALGFLGPNAWSALADRCLFTWPLCLFAAFHGVARACAIGVEKPAILWPTRLWLVVFLTVCGAYFLACRYVGMSIGWYYLFGFPFALPASTWAIRRELRGQPWLAACGLLAAFAVFFWAGESLLFLKTTRGDS
jgi:hypothetical protein